MHENDALDRLQCNQFSDLQWNLKLDLNLAQLPVRCLGSFLQASNDNTIILHVLLICLPKKQKMGNALSEKVSPKGVPSSSILE